MMHGRLLAGLAAWAIERDHGDPDYLPVRLTVDLFRSPSMEATHVDTVLVRAGRRVRAMDATIRVGGVDVARASCLELRRGVAPDDDVPTTPRWDAPGPQPVERETGWDAPFDVWPVNGRGFGAPGPRQVWMRDPRPLVHGIALTPFVRAALAADFASPLANSGSNGLDFINADLTLHLGRLPDGDWIGVETVDRMTSDGVSVAYCRFHDETGPVGFSTVCAVVNPRMA